MALTSGEHLQLSSTRNTMINAGQHLDIGAMKNLSVTVEKALGLFVHKEGLSSLPTGRHRDSGSTQHDVPVF